MLIKFLDLGKQPIANNFLSTDFDKSKEYFYNLEMGFDHETLLVTQVSPIDKELMFHDSYPYSSSTLITMQEHFKLAAENLLSRFKIKSVLEIGSNDGIFLKNVLGKDIKIAGVEPCGNFANLTNSLGIKTFHKFWNLDTAKEVEKSIGKLDLVFSANCMCHIENILEAFSAVEASLSDEGVFVFEDPSLLSMLKNNSYDQIYDEHVHIFSVHALKKVLEKANLRLFHVEHTPVHGGSNRIFACKENASYKNTDFLENAILEEKKSGIDDEKTYFEFAKRVEESKSQLKHILLKWKKSGKRIISYGATSKSTTVFNYCNIDNSIIDLVIDMTPAKIGKLTPGTHIPIKNRESVSIGENDIVFLGAWNFEKEILEKESNALKSGATFISHVPHVRSFSSSHTFSKVHFHEDDRAQRLLNVFINPTERSQFNISYVNSKDHIVAWHGHHVQTDQWLCLKGSFKVGLAYPVVGSLGSKYEVKFVYLSEKNSQLLVIPPGILHGYKALEPGSMLMYHATEKYDVSDEIKFVAGAFGESWETENK